MKTKIEANGKITVIFENENEKKQYENYVQKANETTSKKVEISENEQTEIVVYNFFEIGKFNCGELANFKNWKGETIEVSKENVFKVVSPKTGKAYELSASYAKNTNTSKKEIMNKVKFELFGKKIQQHFTLVTLVFEIEAENNLKTEKGVFSMYENQLIK